jgi:hypothetical protein
MERHINTRAAVNYNFWGHIRNAELVNKWKCAYRNDLVETGFDAVDWLQGRAPVNTDIIKLEAYSNE